MSAEIEQAVLDHGLVNPCHGAVRVEQELRPKPPKRGIHKQITGSMPASFMESVV